MSIDNGLKYDDNKVRVDLVPPKVILALGEVLTYGAKKYGPDNWQKVDNGLRRFYGAALRHLLAWADGEILDPESGLSHLSHALSNLAFMVAIESGKND
ncbi:MAG: DUF5664 domain-containing protein [Deltaproteobacteria bacterium]|jgi:hypothetical protein|nr:DUF5664 domain-containing protein [Deltaproteobacteria bacterium]